MKKWLFSLSFIICTSMNSYAHEKAAEVFHFTDPEYLHPDMIRTGHLAVKGMQVNGFSGESLAKIQRAFAALEKVVNSEEFKERVINFKNTRGERAFASNGGLSNEEIYEKFMEGRETLQPNTPHEMNFYLRLYNKSWSRVIGYTSPTTNVISINWKYFRGNETAEVASNLAHEWTHKIGFGHRSAAEHDSAPYAIGYIVEELAAKSLTTSLIQIASQQ